MEIGGRRALRVLLYMYLHLVQMPMIAVKATFGGLPRLTHEEGQWAIVMMASQATGLQDRRKTSHFHPVHAGLV